MSDKFSSLMRFEEHLTLTTHQLVLTHTPESVDVFILNFLMLWPYMSLLIRTIGVFLRTKVTHNFFTLVNQLVLAQFALRFEYSSAESAIKWHIELSPCVFACTSDNCGGSRLFIAHTRVGFSHIGCVQMYWFNNDCVVVALPLSPSSLTPFLVHYNTWINVPTHRLQILTLKPVLLTSGHSV